MQDAKSFPARALRRLPCVPFHAGGVGVGNLYHYFPSKDSLFCAVLAPITSSFYSMFDRHHGNYADALDMIREEYLVSAVSEYMNLLRGNRTLMKILFFGAQGSSLEHFKSEFTDKATEQVKIWFKDNKTRDIRI